VIDWLDDDDEAEEADLVDEPHAGDHSGSELDAAKARSHDNTR
jgi:hypothetical protein